MSTRPIGVFDSGLGGLTIWSAIKERLPYESLLYFGDGLHCPYGLRSDEEVKTYTLRAAEELLDKGCKMIVVACNTATNAAIESLREKYTDIPIVGMEPAIKPACEKSHSGVVGVIATKRTIEGQMFKATSEKYGLGVKILAFEGRQFVEIVERDMEQNSKTQAIVDDVVAPIVASGADYIVLGCTHYPFLRSAIERSAPGVQVIDSAPAVARQVERRLKEKTLLNEGCQSATYEFLSFAGDEYCERIIEKSRRI